MQNPVTETRQEGQRLERLMSDVLLLVDIVAAKSDKAELISEDELKAAFREKAAVAAAPLKDDLRRQMAESADKAMRERMAATPGVIPIRAKGDADLPPTTREQRKVYTRRALLKSLLGESSDVKEVVAAPAETPVREITDAYFDCVLAEAMKPERAVARIVSWDKVTYYHYKPLLSSSYARLLSAQNNPAELVRDTVRENSRIYPRPISLGCFEDMPFNLKPEEIETVLKVLHDDPDSQDIRFTQTSIGTVFLYSTLYLEDDYADFLAEQIDVGMDDSP